MNFCRYGLALSARAPRERVAGVIRQVRRRELHSSAPRQVQRLLWAGAVLDETSPRLRAATSAWLSALGMGQDAEYGISFTHLAASPSHSLLAYRTLPPSNYELPVPEDEDEPQAHDDKLGTRHKALPGAGDSRIKDSPFKYTGLEKIISIGRNTFSELGLGFSSHESTWGMVQSGNSFAGSNGIKHLAAGLNTSWVVTSSSAGASDKLFAWGNHSLGQLGLGVAAGQDVSASGEAQLRLFSAPRQVELPPLPEDQQAQSESIKGLAIGLDHALVLRGWASEHGDECRQVLGCGLNTDAQLGLPLQTTHSWELRSIVDGPSAQFIAAGGDTSSAYTPGSKVALAWGNSEYTQAVWGGRPFDRIETPVSLQAELEEALGDETIASIAHGGSFTLFLTDTGRVFSIGYGAIGTAQSSSAAPSSTRLLEVSALKGYRTQRISCGLEYACAVTETGQLFVWGLDSTFGRLGLGSPQGKQANDLRVFEPTEVTLPPSVADSQYTVEGIACGGDTLWVLIEQEDGTDRKGRWLGR